MKKQSFFLVAITFTIFTYLVSVPMRVNAGSVGITGSSDDSSSSSGDNFNPVNNQSSPELAPGVNVEIGNDGGSLNTSAEIQNSLNTALSNVLSQTPAANSPAAAILAILQGGANAAQAANQLQASLANLGVPTSSAQSLVSALLGLAGNKSASVSGFTVGTKGLVANSIAQKEASPTVNINQLNAAISAYNKIVMESNPKVLRQLSKDAGFREIGNLLKQLRAALNSKG
ncbi:hypothetical protein [Nostoc sp. ChiVER01]|uniref:hypothetical protein n=1 Tax=Nostoc sp. ChiVER01 TaxID=3075382 RepID=UPI002AD3D2DD|nr:hypothetical protein [Nostoc sp. ChiVER01]MDZ8225845.1 hypothetical protein [Nostoc sp. ChiVER01]